MKRNLFDYAPYLLFAIIGTACAFAVAGRTDWALYLLGGVTGVGAFALLGLGLVTMWEARPRITWWAAKPTSLTQRLRKLHHKELTGACPKCAKSDPERQMMEGGWDGSQIACCSCGHRWILDQGTDSYLATVGPVTSGRGELQRILDALHRTCRRA